MAGDVVGGRRVDSDLAGQHDLLSAPARMRSTARATACS